MQIVGDWKCLASRHNVDVGHFSRALKAYNKIMRRIAIFRDGNKIGAMIGPDLVKGLGGFGDTAPDALRDLAAGFNQHAYELRDNTVSRRSSGPLDPSRTSANSRWCDSGIC